MPSLDKWDVALVVFIFDWKSYELHNHKHIFHLSFLAQDISDILFH